MKKIVLPILLIALMMNVSCKKPAGYGDLAIQVSHSANGKALITDSLCYTSEAGNSFLVTEVQWFLSKIVLTSEQGDEYTLGHRELNSLIQTPQDNIFYIDTNLPESQTLEIAPLPCGKYVKIRFTFGLDENDNQTGLFINPPESNMFWPEPLGGGYHYMKLNGRYLDENEQLAPMNIHLGIGQNENRTVFYQNYFTVELPIDLELIENEEQVIQLDMNIDNWFRSPHPYDIQYFGSAIMQNQEAQQILKENGQDVFSVSVGKSTLERITGTMKSIFSKAAPKPHFYTKKNMKELFAEFGNRKNKQ